MGKLIGFNSSYDEIADSLNRMFGAPKLTRTRTVHRASEARAMAIVATEI